MDNKTIEEVNDLAIMCDAILENDDWRNKVPKCECCGATCGNYTRSFGTREALTLCAACWALLASTLFKDLNYDLSKEEQAEEVDARIEELKEDFQELKKAEEEQDGQ